MVFPPAEAAGVDSENGGERWGGAVGGRVFCPDAGVFGIGFFGISVGWDLHCPGVR